MAPKKSTKATKQKSQAKDEVASPAVHPLFQVDHLQSVPVGQIELINGMKLHVSLKCHQKGVFECYGVSVGQIKLTDTVSNETVKAAKMKAMELLDLRWKLTKLLADEYYLEYTEARLISEDVRFQVQIKIENKSKIQRTIKRLPFRTRKFHNEYTSSGWQQL
ncbi:hypothetical protein K402DRAFT_427346 [Aulographum hederae CBS 113979]|uniref:Uncharacterized protein n=1 Tax=Aulographum hederae CBS 113979 TaxID=1176131 RepID=A0A6G1H721_9PEZI|nr:hypothetical protein K402DRAFT_427346 [Aulographum hederae CBS 113979]